MFGEKFIAHKAICTLDNGERVKMVFHIKQQSGGGISKRAGARTCQEVQ